MDLLGSPCWICLAILEEVCSAECSFSAGSNVCIFGAAVVFAFISVYCSARYNLFC